MGTTPTYGLPYQDLGAAPNGSALGQDLANAVETQLTRMDTQPSMQVFTASATYTKPAGLKAVRVHVQAGGGGSAGSGSATAGLASVGAPGGGGEYATAIIPAASLAASTAVTVGAGGAGSGAVGGSGSAGGNSSFGGYVGAVGGGGGSPTNNVSSGVNNGGNPGTGGGGTASNILRVAGQRGAAGRVIGGEPFPQPGGDSHLGFGGPIATAQNTTEGAAGQLYGGGGSSSWARAVAGALGSDGAAGVVICENLY